MTERKSLARNTVYSAVSSASNVFLIVLVIVAARLLGDKAFGMFSFALALASIFEMFIDLGLNTLSARNVSRDRKLADVYLPAILGWKLILSIIVMALLVLTVKLMHQPREAELAAYIIGGAIVIRSFKATSFAFFQAFERFDLILLTTYIERFSGLIFGLAALLLTRSLIAFVSAFALIRIPDILITYWFVHRAITPVRIRFEPRVIRKLQSAAVAFALSSIVLVAYMCVGTVILSAMRPPAEVGWYNAGSKIYEGLTTFPFLICAVLLPRLSLLFTFDRDAYDALCRRVLRYLLIASVPIVIAMALLAPRVIGLVYGAQYSPAVPVLRLLLAASLFMFVNWVLNTILIAADLEKAALRNWAMGLAVMTTANLILIPRLGMIGTAYSVIAAEISVFLMMAVSVRRRLLQCPVRRFDKQGEG